MSATVSPATLPPVEPVAADGATVRINNLSKVYRLYNQPLDRLREALNPWRRCYHSDFHALHDVSLTVAPGESVGILGRNGSGKSTLLKIVAGVATPTAGEARVNGRVSALLELGAGFNPELSGMENIHFSGMLLGFSRAEMEEKAPAIAAFADIGEFIHHPVRTYSSGMFARLGFAVAISVEPRVLLVDEALSVGDARFQQRCIRRIRELREKGVSIMFVSHDFVAVKAVCDTAYVLDAGQVVFSGPAERVSNWYLSFLSNDYDLEKTRRMQETALAAERPETGEAAPPSAPEPAAAGPATQTPPPPAPPGATGGENPPEFTYFRFGDGGARFTAIRLLDESGQAVEHVYMGRPLRFRLEAEFHQDQPEHLLGFYIRNRLGADILGTNTFQERVAMPAVQIGQRVVYEMEFVNHLKPGHYSLSPSLAYDQFSNKWLDWIDHALIFQVVDPLVDRAVFGAVHIPDFKIQVNVAPAGD